MSINRSNTYMPRIVIVGTSCSGKTQLAKRIAKLLTLAHIELDELYWKPNWTPSPIENFRAIVDQATDEDRWLVDGNYGKVRDIVWRKANHLIWLNYSFRIVFWRAIVRTMRRVISREELFAGNRETLGRVLFDRESIVWWVIRTYKRRRREYRKILESVAFQNLELLELSNPKEAETLLEMLPKSRLSAWNSNLS